jgi:hypothetical protein
MIADRNLVDWLFERMMKGSTVMFTWEVIDNLSPLAEPSCSAHRAEADNILTRSNEQLELRLASSPCRLPDSQLTSILTLRAMHTIDACGWRR